MRPIEDISQSARRWSRFSLACNGAALVLAGLLYVTHFIWIVLIVDVFILAGLAFFLRAFYHFLRAGREALGSFLPALLLQLVLLIAVGTAFWIFWNKPDIAQS